MSKAYREGSDACADAAMKLGFVTAAQSSTNGDARGEDMTHTPDGPTSIFATVFHAAEYHLRAFVLCWG